MSLDKELIHAKRKMQWTLLIDRITKNLAFYQALFHNMNNTFFGDLRYRQAFGKNSVNSIFGSTGGGKSFAGMYIAQMMKADWTCKDLYFSDDDIIQALSVCPEGTINMKDEQIEMFGEGSKQQEAVLENIEATVRIRQISLIYCSPKLKLHNNHYSLEVFYDWHESRKATALWLYKDNETENPIGWIMTRLPNIDFTEYRKRKLEFVDAVRRQEVGSGEVIKRNAERFLSSNYMGALATIKEIKTAFKTDPMFDQNLTVGQIDTIVSYITMKSRDEHLDLFMNEEKRRKIEEKLTKMPKRVRNFRRL